MHAKYTCTHTYIHTVLRLLSPDNSATNPTPHESLSNDGSYNPRGFSGTEDNAERTFPTLSFGDRPGPSDCQNWSLPGPEALNRVPKNFLSNTFTNDDFFAAAAAEHRVPNRVIGAALSFGFGWFEDLLSESRGEEEPVWRWKIEPELANIFGNYRKSNIS